MRQGSIQSWIKRPSDAHKSDLKIQNSKSDIHMASTNSKSAHENLSSENDSPIIGRKKRNLVKNSFLDDQDSQKSK
jgi:hypothetical protein